MANTILGFPNHVDNTFDTVVLSGGSWEVSLPLTNLIDPVLSRVARSTGLLLANTQFDLNLGAPKSVRLISIPSHNFSSTSKIRIRAFEDNTYAGTPVYDSGWRDIWSIIYDWGSVDWGHPSLWDGKLSPEDAAEYTVGYICVLVEDILAQFWRFEFDDQLNDDGYIELGRLFTTPGWQPTINMDVGASLAWTTNTTKTRSWDVDYFGVRRPRRVVQFELNNLPEDEMLYHAFEMDRMLGIDKQLMYIYDPADTYHMHRRSFVGRLRELTRIEFPHPLRITSKAFQIEEVL